MSTLRTQARTAAVEDAGAPAHAFLPPVSAIARARRLAKTSASGLHRIGPPALRALAKRRVDPESLVRGMTAMFEEMGATYVKFGQLLASAPAVVGEDVAQQFRTCLDAGPAVAFPAVVGTIERELRRPIEELYAHVEPEPIAAASVAVVHRARLHDGRAVAVKVLRPGIEHAAAADLAIMLPVCRFMARQGSDIGATLFNYLIGLREQIAEEVDLRNEARAMEEFRALFEQFGLNRIAIPRVERGLSGRRVLTMEFLDGVPVDDFTRVAASGVDVKPLIRQLVEAWVLTGVRAGMFHGDIHAGNMLLLGDGRLGLLDWGIVARLDPDSRRMFRALVEAACGLDASWDDIADYVIRLQGRVLRAGLGLSDPEIRRVVRAMMEPVLTRPVGEVSMASLFAGGDEIIRLATGRDAPKRSFGERLDLWRKNRRAIRLSIDEGVAEHHFRRASLLAAKQLLYLERYWRIYLPQEALLGDRAFLMQALAASDRAP